MKEEKKAALPVLNTDQKLRVVLAHRNFVRADAQLALAQQAAQVAHANLSAEVDAVGKELGLAKDQYNLDMDSLALSVK